MEIIDTITSIVVVVFIGTLLLGAGMFVVAYITAPYDDDNRFS